jgi:hypothetical protein
MLPCLRARYLLAVFALLGALLPLNAAPAPVVGGPPALDKYFLDDTDFVLVVNFKEIAASPLFAKNFRKALDARLGRSMLRPVLDALAIDPLKDIDRAVVLLGRSCYPKTNPTSDGPVFLLQGRFNVAKVSAGLNKLPRGRKGEVWAAQEAGGDVYSLHNLPPLNGSVFVAVLDSSTIILAGHKPLVLDAVAKAKGKKVTKFTVKGVPARVKKLRPDVAVQGFGLGSMVINSQTVTENVNGQIVTRRTFRTLEGSGAREFEINIAVKDEAQGRFVLTAKDKASLKELSQPFTQMMPLLKDAIKQQAQGNAKLAPLAKFFEDLRLRTADDAVIIEGKATAAMIQSFVDLVAMAP